MLPRPVRSPAYLPRITRATRAPSARTPLIPHRRQLVAVPSAHSHPRLPLPCSSLRHITFISVMRTAGYLYMHMLSRQSILCVVHDAWGRLITQRRSSCFSIRQTHVFCIQISMLSTHAAYLSVGVGLQQVKRPELRTRSSRLTCAGCPHTASPANESHTPPPPQSRRLQSKRCMRGAHAAPPTRSPRPPVSFRPSCCCSLPAALLPLVPAGLFSCFDVPMLACGSWCAGRVLAVRAGVTPGRSRV
ncbi:hypothetical protein BD779DRAFT_755186 [Infundibulicybe gibba]|nr:hypothetical protein BD779DRAFT_755186 [Infundibulicybe gibba]